MYVGVNILTTDESCNRDELHTYTISSPREQY